MTLQATLVLTDPVGPQEIAQRLGRPLPTVHSWRNRSEKGMKRAVPLPEPDTIISNTPLWSWDRIEDWARETGRYE